ncbi:MAG: hypothetical protein ABGY95_11195 [Rubritalea sp.]|uniref:hypothetical protein n=1 Tax=Rubritalea sp. TaxID=2109375 RepID=UPI003242B225
MNIFTARTNKIDHTHSFRCPDDWFTTLIAKHEYSADYLTDWKYVKNKLPKYLAQDRLFNTIGTKDLVRWADSLKT